MEGLTRVWISWTTRSQGSSWPTRRMGTGGAAAERWIERQGDAWSPENTGSCASAVMAVPLPPRSTSVTHSRALLLMILFTPREVESGGGGEASPPAAVSSATAVRTCHTTVEGAAQVLTHYQPHLENVTFPHISW